MNFDDDKFVILNVGVGRQDGSFENNKVDDLCPTCYNSVKLYIENKQASTINLDLDAAADILRENKFVVYKKPPNWGIGRHKGSKKKEGK